METDCSSLPWDDSLSYTSASWYSGSILLMKQSPQLQLYTKEIFNRNYKACGAFVYKPWRNGCVCLKIAAIL